MFSSEYEKTDKSTNRTVLRNRLHLGHLHCVRPRYREMTPKGCSNCTLLTLKMLKHSDRRKEAVSVGLVSRSAVPEFYVSHPFVCQHHEWLKSLCLSTATFAVRSKAWVCGRSVAGIAGSNPAGSMDTCLL